MSNNREKTYTRAVMAAIEDDTTLAHPTYMGILAEVRKHCQEVENEVRAEADGPVPGFLRRVSDKLIARIKPNAGKAG